MTEPKTSTISVDLSIPVQADLVVLARLAAATLAGRAGFGVEDIEDLRLAVEELCLSVVGGREHGRLRLRYECEGDAIDVVCWYEDDDHHQDSARRTRADDLSLRILDALVDEHGRGLRDGRVGAWLRKRRSDGVI
jgi:anti-sigma regulatory factor (Ser/Thr protein kinase)